MFRRKYMLPILQGREKSSTASQKRKMVIVQGEMSDLVNQFILRRTNTLNAKHLPPKLTQVIS